MEEFFAAVAITCVLALACFGVIFIAGDFRHFDEIAKQCTRQGYIQDNTIRIICQKEAHI